MCAILLVLALCLMALPFADAAPVAGTSIGNQASATYSDSSATVRTVTSNSVVTIVQQVASLTLGSNGAKQVSLGGLVTYPHTVTNTGNGNDSFNLSTSNSGTFSFLTVTIYADVNGDGVPDSTTPITSTGSIAPGGTFNFVVVGVVPPTAVAGNTNSLVVTAASALTPAVTASNTDTTTVSGNAVINVTKSIDLAAGLAGSGPRTFTLTYTNTGNSTATNLTLTDVIPSGMTYVGGSGRWSGSGATVLTDANSADNQSGIVYDYAITLATRVTAVIASVPAGASGTLSFQVNINGGLAPGANPATLNTAQFSYNDGAGVIPAASTNAVQFVVTSVGAVSVTGATVASATQGSTVSFSNLVTNTGNGSDSFDITLGTSTFPTGTTFVLYRADGVTPLVDSNGNGIPDTGPLAAGTSVTVVLKAILPAGVSGVGPFSIPKIATSRLDPTKTASGNDILTAISANTVDITNNAPSGVGALGVGAGPEVTAVATNTVVPGATTRFTLYASNGSTTADTFNLQASTSSSFASVTLPTGWSVVFRDLNGAVITNSGVVNAGGNALVYADVTVPVGSSASTTDLYFRALSPVSGAADTVHNAVIISGLRGITLTPNNSGQAYPGGSVVYRHTLTNSGNVVEGNGTTGQVSFAVSNTAPGFAATIYWDKNNNGALDASDPIVTSTADFTGGTGGASTAAGLDPGESAVVFVKVLAAASATPGTVDTATLVATVSGTISGVSPPSAVSATDSTAVIPGQLRLDKLQALDAACDGTADTAFSNVNITTGALPGACIRYQITATNAGVADVTGVIVSDATPANTTYHATIAAATSQGSISAPSGGTAGTIQATVGTMTPGQVVVVSFGVRINP
ncbi:hypothetical protein VVD49_04245 [Uliginosibacterium sp. H3]|uniref:DUF11 domain-containing protein n=1 Tax=Uliginosibacterium silvisoli TaxID=3114758 RepID=A0ABU6JZ25_9RHOO|nr:hypothetical protein [Uliginosibacterium sp. H3]